jgi:hypothetical protein
MHETMSDHLVLALEAFPTGHVAARAAFDGTVVWSVLAVDVFVRAAESALVSLITSFNANIAFWVGEGNYLSKYCVWNGAAVQPGQSHLNPELITTALCGIPGGGGRIGLWVVGSGAGGASIGVV